MILQKILLSLMKMLFANGKNLGFLVWLVISLMFSYSEIFVIYGFMLAKMCISTDGH